MKQRGNLLPALTSSLFIIHHFKQENPSFFQECPKRHAQIHAHLITTETGRQPKGCIMTKGNPQFRKPTPFLIHTCIRKPLQGTEIYINNHQFLSFVRQIQRCHPENRNTRRIWFEIQNKRLEIYTKVATAAVQVRRKGLLPNTFPSKTLFEFCT